MMKSILVQVVSSPGPRLLLGLGGLALAMCLAAPQQDAAQSAAGPSREQDTEPVRPTVVYAEDLLIQIAVTDLDAACAFYGEVMDLPLISRTESLKWAKFRLPTGAQLGVGEADVVSGSGTCSVNISVEDIEAARALLEKRGVEFDGPTQLIPGVVRLADFEDPDGNRIRLAGAP